MKNLHSNSYEFISAVELVETPRTSSHTIPKLSRNLIAFELKIGQIIIFKIHNREQSQGQMTVKRREKSIVCLIRFSLWMDCARLKAEENGFSTIRANLVQFTHEKRI